MNIVYIKLQNLLLKSIVEEKKLNPSKNWSVDHTNCMWEQIFQTECVKFLWQRRPLSCKLRRNSSHCRSGLRIGMQACKCYLHDMDNTLCCSFFRKWDALVKHILQQCLLRNRWLRRWWGRCLWWDCGDEIAWVPSHHHFHCYHSEAIDITFFSHFHRVS